MIEPNGISGHAPGHVRDRFVELIETDGHVEANAFSAEFTSLAGRLWNCTDIVPGSVCALLGEPCGSTYAQLAWRIRSGACSHG